ncbi:transmembrane protein 217-like [Trichosurus vulpecula]|uniref:transmembrane protein 217-like n=1 Tax=Trichosurus vulpecula TaxID=9337 RepID=UPI00186B090C|nr:transmembrane protein 217-like [Trichosurus vulpecula]
MEKQNWFGLNAQLGTFLSGVFTIFVTAMYVVFEEKYMRNPNCSTENKLGETVNDYIICWSYSITFCLSIVTILISCLLLYSVYAKVYQGMVIYVIWIIFYEAVNTLLQSLTNSTRYVIPREVRFLRWFGLISCIFMHGFWMFFVIKYAHIVYRNQMQSKVISYSRRLSTNVESKRERPPYPNMPKLSYPSRIRIK